MLPRRTAGSGTAVPRASRSPRGAPWPACCAVLALFVCAPLRAAGRRAAKPVLPAADRTKAARGADPAAHPEAPADRASRPAATAKAAVTRDKATPGPAEGTAPPKAAGLTRPGPIPGLAGGPAIPPPVPRTAPEKAEEPEPAGGNAAGRTGDSVLAPPVDPMRAPAPPAPKPPAPKPPAAEAPAAEAPAAEAPAAEAPAAEAPAAKPPAATKEPPPAAPKRAAGTARPVQLFHKTALEAMRYFQKEFPQFIADGRVDTVEGHRRTLLVFGNDAQIKEVEERLRQFDNMELDLVARTYKLRYIDGGVVLEAMPMAGVANVWTRVKKLRIQQWKEGKYTRKFEYPDFVWVKVGPEQGEVLPANALDDKIPYCFELPGVESFEYPPIFIGRSQADNQSAINFQRDPSTEDRNVIVAVGTEEDHQRIRAYLDMIDRPARQIMVDCEIIEMTASAFHDYGLDSLSTGQRHSVLNWAGALGGEAITQPGLPASFHRPGTTEFPEIIRDGLGFIFDDKSIDLSGRFLLTLHDAVRKGDATVKARPKLLTVDSRRNLLHIGQEVPVFDEQAVTTDVTGGNFAQNIRRVSRQYVGITLNIRPRIAGEDAKEVAMDLEIAMNELGTRIYVDNVDLMGVPTVITRHFVGKARVQNHRPLILGGLINEEESETTHKVPLLGEIPYIGSLLSRTIKTKDRMEIIVVVTPHILSEEGPDRISTPKDSSLFDTLGSVLFNDRYIVKPSDLIGVDPITKRPLKAMEVGEQVFAFTEAECVDLTLLNIVRKLELVRKLEILKRYLDQEASKHLGWFQRLCPDRNAKYWDDDDKKIYYKAAAIVIENIKELNEDLDFEELAAKPNRELVLPSEPGNVVLSFDKLKHFYQKGFLALRGVEKVSDEAVKALLEAEGHTLKDFAAYVRGEGRTEEDHKGLRAELTALYKKLHPEGEDLSGLEYPDFLEELGRKGINFTTIATYFRENLTTAYARTGVPEIGTFVADVKTMLETSLTIDDRAERLQELERKWDLAAGEEE